MSISNISVVLAVFNGEAFISNQLQSIVEQTLQPTELIVCDDNSTDSSWSILQAFALIAPFKVVLLKNENNIGYSKTFERCLAAANYEYIFFCDQDDVWLPEKISYSIQKFDQDSNIKVLIHDGKLVDRHLNWHGVTKLAQVRALYGDDRFISGALTIIRRSFVSMILPIPNGIHYDTWVHALSQATNLRAIDERILQLIRRHDSNASQGLSSNILSFNYWQLIQVKLRGRRRIYWQETAHLTHSIVDRLRIIFQRPDNIIHDHIIDNKMHELQLYANRLESLLSLPLGQFLCRFL